MSHRHRKITSGNIKLDPKVSFCVAAKALETHILGYTSSKEHNRSSAYRANRLRAIFFQYIAIYLHCRDIPELATNQTSSCELLRKVSYHIGSSLVDHIHHSCRVAGFVQIHGDVRRYNLNSGGASKVFLNSVSIHQN